MSDRIIKLLGTEVALSTATTLGRAQLVRVYNDTATDVLLTVVAVDTTSSTVTLKAGDVVHIRKYAGDTIASSAAVKAVSVSFGD